MTRKLTVSDTTVEQLSDRKRPDETYGAVVRRLLAETDTSESASADGEQLAPNDLPDLSSEQLAAANDLAYEVLDGRDIANGSKEQLSPREYVAKHKGVDPADYTDATALRKAVEETD